MSDQIQDQPITPDTQPQVTPSPAPVVPRADFERVNAEYQKMQSDYQRMIQEQKDRELNEAKRKNNWQMVAEAKEREAQEAIAKVQRIEQSYLNERKFSALKDSALRLGLRKEAIEDLALVALDDVAVESTSTGKINILGAESAAEKLKMLRPHWFSQQTSAQVNTSIPTVSQGRKVSIDDIFTAEKEAKKSGDYSGYQKLLNQYRTQK